jgi:hypothetical protein
MTTESHPYRTQDPIPLCVTCGSPAHLRCPGCDRPFCIDHARVAPTCEDCARARRGRPVGLAGLVGYTLGLGGVTGFVFTFNPIAGGVLGVLGALGAGIVAAIASRRGRSGKRGWEVIEGNALRVRADGGDDDAQPEHRRTLSRRWSRSGAAFQNSLGRFQLG